MKSLRLAPAVALALLAGPALAAQPTPAQYLSDYGRIQRVEDAKICAPGISRCGADGYVERCNAAGTYWQGTMLHCK